MYRIIFVRILYAPIPHMQNMAQEVHHKCAGLAELLSALLRAYNLPLQQDLMPVNVHVGAWAAPR